MSGIDFTTTALLASIKRRASIPDSQNLYTDADILHIATEELHSEIVPLILAVREEYMVTDYDQTIVSGTNSYRIPARAVGQKLHDAVLLNTDGQEISIPRGDPAALKKEWMAGAYIAYANRTKFYFKDDAVVLFPDAGGVASSFTLRMKYYRRPNNLVGITYAGQITVITTATKTITVSTWPTGVTFAATDTFDLIKGTPSFRSLGDDLAVSSISSSGKTLTFSATLPTDLAVGDWVAQSGFSPIAQIPYEVHNLLAQRTVIKLLEGLGDKDGLQDAAGVYTDMIEKFRDMVTPRADDSPKKIVRSNALWSGTHAPRWQNW